MRQNNESSWTWIDTKKLEETYQHKQANFTSFLHHQKLFLFLILWAKKTQNLQKLYDSHVFITFPDIYCRKCDEVETLACRLEWNIMQKAKHHVYPLYPHFLIFCLHLTRGLFVFYVVSPTRARNFYSGINYCCERFPSSSFTFD